MASTTFFTGKRTLLPTSDAFWDLLEGPIAVSLYNTWTGRNARSTTNKNDLRGRVRNAKVTIDWGRIARWLKSQAGDPSPLVPEGVKAWEWAFDRQFYMHCRVEEIDVEKLLQDPEFGLAAHMAPPKTRTREGNSTSDCLGESASVSADAPETSRRDTSSPLSDIPPSSPSQNPSREATPGDPQDPTPAKSTVSTPAPSLAHPEPSDETPESSPAKAETHIAEAPRKRAQTGKHARNTLVVFPVPPPSTAQATESSPPASAHKSPSSSSTIVSPNPHAVEDEERANGARSRPALSPPDASAIPHPRQPPTTAMPSQVSSASGSSTLRSTPAHGHPANLPPSPSAQNISNTPGSLNMPIVADNDSPPAPATQGPMSNMSPNTMGISTPQIIPDPDSTHHADDPRKCDTPDSHRPLIPVKRRCLTSPPRSLHRLGPLEGRAIREGGMESVDEDDEPMSPRPETDEPDIIRAPYDEQDDSEYAGALKFIFQQYSFVNRSNETPDFDKVTIYNCRHLSGKAMVGIFSNDPRPSTMFLHGSKFFCKARIPVYYNPYLGTVSAISADILNAVFEDTRFQKGLFVVKGKDATRHSYTLGCFGPKTTYPMQPLRMPVEVVRPKTFFAQHHQMYLALKVEIEICPEDEKPDTPATIDHPEESDSEEAGSEVGSAAVGTSTVQAKSSKGKQRASAGRKSSTRRPRQDPQDRQEPRVPRTDAEKYVVQYIGRQKGPDGQPWNDNELVKGMRRMCDNKFMNSDKMLLAVDVVDVLLNLTINNAEAPFRLAGKKVTGKALAVFLNIHDNWIGIAKAVKRHKDLHKDNVHVQAYLQSVGNLGTSAPAMLKGMKEVLQIRAPAKVQTSTTHKASGSNKRQRMVLSSDDDDHGGPSNFEPDFGGTGYLTSDDE